MTNSANKRRFAAKDHEIGAKLDDVEVAAHIADAASGLNKIAKQRGLSFLSYLLELVVLEARIASGRSQDNNTASHPRQQ